MRWFRTNLSAAKAGVGLERLALDRADAILTSHNWPATWAFFSGDGWPEGQVALYLTPDFARWREAVLPGRDWQACQAPPEGTAHLLVGSEKAKSLLGLRGNSGEEA